MNLDLSKYEGHTPGPWEKKTPSEIYPASLEDCRIIFPPLGYAGPIAEVSGEPDALLIADAPQLLAELREAREKIKKADRLASATDALLKQNSHELWLDAAAALNAYIALTRKDA